MLGRQTANWPSPQARDYRFSDGTRSGSEGQSDAESECGSGRGHTELADAEFKPGSPEQLENARERPGSGARDGSVPVDSGSIPLFAPGPGATELWQDLLVRRPELRPAVSSAEIESLVCDLDDGLAAVVDGSRTDQLRACGNGIVPLQSAVAITILSRRFEVKEGVSPC